jgi:hypothetical protein
MMKCPSGKRQYLTESVAEEALIEARIQFDYRQGNGPVAVYQCEDCGNYHLTSKGTMNVRLSQLLEEGKIQKQKQAQHWQRKWK